MSPHPHHRKYPATNNAQRATASTHASRQPPHCLLPVACLVLALAGCRGVFNQKEYLQRTIPPEEIHEIDAIQLEDRSIVPPVTVDQAAANLTEEIFTPPSAPEKLEVTLADVRAAALANNLDLAVEVVNPTIALTDVDVEEARFEWVLFASARRSVTDSPTALGTEGSRSTFDAFDVGLDIPLRTGGLATIALPISELETNNPFSLLNPSYTADARFSISHDLLRNAGVNANTHPIRVARYQHTIVGSRTKLEAIRILANADRAYWRLYAAKRELEVRNQQYELARRQLDQAQRRVEAGDVAQIEVTRAESGVASSLEDIIIAQTAVRRNQRDLKRIMNRAGLPMNSPTELIPITQPTPLGLELDAEALADFAVANRMEMLELELQLAIDASAIDLRRNEKLPLLTLDYTYNIGGLGSSYNQAFDQVGSKRFEDWSLGVRAEIPIGNEAAKARFHGAVLQRLQRLATREQRTAAIRQEVFDAIDQLEQDWQRILAARQEALLAGRTYDAEQRQFEVGLRTSTDVLDAATRLADAQSREILALADYEISQVDIAFATGTLLGQARVRWEPYPYPG